MSKVFRLQDNNTPGLAQGEDWFNSNKYVPNLINAIQDPDGGLGNVPTSIPTPFARIDLFNTAFKVVSESNDLDGNTVFHRMVSEALDIAEILFYSHLPQIKNNLEIVKWQVSDIDNLINSNLIEHRKYGETLKLYIDQDDNYFNFSKLNGLYIIKYRNQIIGGTSPLTLFFASEDNGINLNDITFPNGDIPFDDKYHSLDTRDKEFIIYLFALRVHYPNFSIRFANLNSYLGVVLEKIHHVDQQLYSILSDIPNLIATYSDSNKLQNIILPNGILEIFNIPLKQEKDNIDNLKSDFKIKNLKNIHSSNRLPLILKNSHDGLDSNGNIRKYINDGNWQKNYNVPLKPTESNIENRILPNVGLPYPWLTVSDFFEPYLIRLVYPIDSKKYFDGNQKKKNDIDKGFLLPIKSIFFDYFDSDWLINKRLSDGKPIYELNEVGNNNIRATLRIPIEKGYIEFDRIYFNGGKPNEENNEGAILECQFGLTIFPFFKTDDPEYNAHYRIQVIDRDISTNTRQHNYSIKLFDNNGALLDSIIQKDRFKKQFPTTGTRYFMINKEFDIIQVDNGVAKGVIIPKFKKVSTNGSEDYTFAIDFGTTNTHIEYCSVSNQSPRPFEINTEEEVQIGSLIDNVIIKKDRSLHGSGATDIYFYIEQELIPEFIGYSKNYSFPIRTVMACNDNIEENQGLYTFANSNIPFVYHKKGIAKGTKTITNLKWSNLNNNFNKEVVNVYIESLMFLIKNKIMLNNGNLNKTKIKWFYPSSMNKGRIDELNNIFSKHTEKYFNGNKVEEPILESIAPFYYYHKAKNVSSQHNPFLLIDIGGETTDFVVYKGNSPLIHSSFRFAGNALFGDGFSPLMESSSNWFISTYCDEIISNLDISSYQDLSQILAGLKNTNKTNEIISFLFSLEKNQDIINNQDTEIFSFTKKLQENEKIKIAFIIFYVSIIYHISRSLKARSIDLPRYIGFSGTASKILNIFCTSKTTITEFTKKIFEMVYNQKFDNNGLDLIIDEKPKETTCKGGLLYNNGSLVNLERDIYLFENGNDLKTIKYNNISENHEVLENIKNEYLQFVTFLSELNNIFNFNEHFNSISNIEVVTVQLKKDILQSIKEGIELRKSELADPNTCLDETLFFYPLINNLYKVIQNLEI